MIKTNNKIRIEELIINEANIQDLINKEYIKYDDKINELRIIIKVKSLIINLPNIIKLYCYRCEIEKIDISKCINLEILNCLSNNIKELNINHITTLRIIFCQFNCLKELKIDKLINLKELLCYNNQLEELNINNLINLEDLEDLDCLK